jgi:hypothetical protein
VVQPPAQPNKVAEAENGKARRALIFLKKYFSQLSELKPWKSLFKSGLLRKIGDGYQNTFFSKNRKPSTSVLQPWKDTT